MKDTNDDWHDMEDDVDDSENPEEWDDEDEDLGDHRSAIIRFATNLAMGRPIEVHQGSARGWLHVSDAVRAIEAAAHVKNYSVINIGHPKILSIADMAEMVRAELGASSSLITVKELPDRMTLVKQLS